MVGQIGVKGHGVAGAQVMRLAVANQHDGAGLDERGLAAARLVHGWVARTAGYGTRRQRVAGQLRPLTRQRRSEDFVEMPAMAPTAAWPLAPLAAPHDRDGAVLVEAKQLAEAQVESGGDPSRHLERRARLPSLDLT